MPTVSGRVSRTERMTIGNQAGRYHVICLFGSASSEASQKTLDAILQRRDLFDDRKISFVGVSVDPADETTGRVQSSQPGITIFWDFNQSISRQLGAIGPTDKVLHPMFVIVDPQMRVYAVLRFEDELRHIPRLFTMLDSLPEPSMHAGVPMQAPVLVVPRIFEPVLCEKLVELYETGGGADSGFMRDVNGRTVGIIDYRLKRRSDHEIKDAEIKQMTQRRIVRRLLPEIEKAYQFHVSRIERYIVACYDSGVGGYFKPHRDNTTKGTAHRKFAVTINLNFGDYEGGGLNFPEYGPQVYQAPRGGAVVFSCSILHQAMPVTSGRRYAFLPFLYDEASAILRRENSQYLDRKPKPDEEAAGAGAGAGRPAAAASEADA
jgi:peroxiredoxin